MEYSDENFSLKFKNFSIKKSSLLQIGLSIYFFIVILLKSLYFADNLSSNSSEIYFNIFSIIIIISLTMLLKPKNSFIVLTVIDLLIAVLLLANNLYFRYYYNLLSLHLIKQIGVVGKIEGTIKALITPTDLLYFVDFLFTIPIYYFCFIKHKVIDEEKKKSKVKVITCIVTMMLSIVAITYKVIDIKKNDPELFTTIYDNNYIKERTGIFVYEAFDIYRYTKGVFEDKELKTQETMQQFQNHFANKPIVESSYFGDYKGKNLIMVQMEAVQGFVINSKLNGKEITPNLNQLVKDSLYFDNVFVQTAAGNTSDAEILSNTSLYPVSQGATTEQYGQNTYQSIGVLLKREGYSTFSAHGFHPEFWNRINMHKALGFDRFYSSNELVMDETLGWGLKDNSFFRQCVEIMSKENKPFYSFLVTLSNHHPYDAYAAISDFDVTGIEGELMQNYLKSVHEADKAVGEFIQQLKDVGLYDNSIIVLYGDHEGITGNDIENLNIFLGIDKDDEFQQRQYEKVPLIIHVPDEKLKGTISKTAGQIDIMPTVLNLLGVKPEYEFGSDILNVENNLVVLRDGSYIDDNYMYFRGTDCYYDRLTGELATDVVSRKEEALSQLQLSDLIFELDLLKEMK